VQGAFPPHGWILAFGALPSTCSSSPPLHPIGSPSTHIYPPFTPPSLPSLHLPQSFASFMSQDADLAPIVWHSPSAASQGPLLHGGRGSAVPASSTAARQGSDGSGVPMPAQEVNLIKQRLLNAVARPRERRRLGAAGQQLASQRAGAAAAELLLDGLFDTGGGAAGAAPSPGPAAEPGPLSQQAGGGRWGAQAQHGTPATHLRGILKKHGGGGSGGRATPASVVKFRLAGGGGGRQQRQQQADFGGGSGGRGGSGGSSGSGSAGRHRSGQKRKHLLFLLDQVERECLQSSAEAGEAVEGDALPTDAAGHGGVVEGEQGEVEAGVVHRHALSPVVLDGATAVSPQRSFQAQMNALGSGGGGGGVGVMSAATAIDEVAPLMAGLLPSPAKPREAAPGGSTGSREGADGKENHCGCDDGRAAVGHQHHASLAAALLQAAPQEVASAAGAGWGAQGATPPGGMVHGNREGCRSQRPGTLGVPSQRVSGCAAAAAAQQLPAEQQQEQQQQQQQQQQPRGSAAVGAQLPPSPYGAPPEAKRAQDGGAAAATAQLDAWASDELLDFDMIDLFEAEALAERAQRSLQGHASTSAAVPCSGGQVGGDVSGGGAGLAAAEGGGAAAREGGGAPASAAQLPPRFAGDREELHYRVMEVHQQVHEQVLLLHNPYKVRGRL
jgi:hypothetical protein